MSVTPEIIDHISERAPDHVYTHESLPDLIMSGSVRSWDIRLPNAEATVGEISPGTAAVFPVDARGERISLVLSEESAQQLGLFVLTAAGSRLVQLENSNPSTQTLPGQRILVPVTGEKPTYYLCEYRNEAGQLDQAVSPAFESIRSIVWNITHGHPRITKNTARSTHIIEVDKRPENDLRIQFSYSPEENQRELMFYDDIEAEIGQAATLLCGISATGRLHIEGLSHWSQRDWHRFLLLADGRVLYRNTTQRLTLHEEEVIALKEWLVGQASTYWNKEN